MQVSSTYRYAKIFALQGARSHAPQFQGLPVFGSARSLVAFSPKKAAGFIAKNAEEARSPTRRIMPTLRVDGLVVKEATVGEGPTMKADDATRPAEVAAGF